MAVNMEKGKRPLLRKPRPPKPKQSMSFRDRVTHVDGCYEIDTMSLTSSGSDLSETNTQYLAHSTPVVTSQTNFAVPPPTTTLNRAQYLSKNSSKQSHVKPIAKWERRYVLDATCASRSTMASTVVRKTLLKPQKSRGPDPLLAREPKHNSFPLKGFIAEDDDIRYQKPPLFTLNNFMLNLSEREKLPIDKVCKAVLSTANFKRITEVVARCLHAHEEQPDLKYVDVDLDALDEIDDFQVRVPSYHVLLEMTALIKQRICDMTQTDVTCAVKQLPRYDPHYKIGEAPHTEIVVFEKDKPHVKSQFVQFKPGDALPTRDALISASGARAFQDTNRASSPFKRDDDQVSPAEVAVLDSLMSGGIALSLKANFIQDMPDISMLVRTLTYINLSYNNFHKFPTELFLVKQLQILKMRNNPLNEIPPQIDELSQLESLVVSFCLISTVPVSLYSLRRLRVLDMSYNKLSFLHSEIRHLRDLSFLNVEGNELTSLPCGVLRLRLKKLRVRNNFMHPLLWKENMTNQPQRLTDICSLTFATSGLHNYYYALQQKLPKDIDNLLMQYNQCDCCREPRYGPGLRLIRPASKLFGVRMLPIMFLSCSPSCLTSFMESFESIAKQLYFGESENDDKENYSISSY